METQYHLRRHDDRQALIRIGATAAGAWIDATIDNGLDHLLSNILSVRDAAEKAFYAEYMRCIQGSATILCDDRELGLVLYAHAFIDYVATVIESHYQSIVDRTNAALAKAPR